MFKHFVAIFLGLVLALPVLAQPDTPTSPRPREKFRPNIRSLDFAQDGTLLVAGVTIGEWLQANNRYVPHSSELRAWDASNGRLKWRVPGQSNARTEVIVSPDSRKVIEWGEWSRFDGEYPRFVRAHLVIRDASNGAVLHAPELEDGERIGTVFFSPDSKILVTGSYVQESDQNPVVKMWDVATGKLIARHKGVPGFLQSSFFTADGKSLVLVYPAEGASLVEWRSFPGLKLQRELEINDYVAGPNSISHNQELLAGGALEADGTATNAIGLWDLVTGQRQAHIRPAYKDVSLGGATFTPDDRTLILEVSYPLPGREDVAPEFMTVLHFYDIQTETLQRTLEAKEKQVTGEALRYLAQLGPDGKSFLATSGNKVELRSLEDSKVVQTFEVPE